ALRAALNVEKPMFSKLSRIGRDERLYAADVLPHLPMCWSTLYLISKFSDDELNDALKEKVIKPKAKRAAIAAWLKAKRGIPDKPRAVKLPEPFFAGLVLPDGLGEEKVREIEGVLARLHDGFGAAVVKQGGAAP